MLKGRTSEGAKNGQFRFAIMQRLKEALQNPAAAGEEFLAAARSGSLGSKAKESVQRALETSKAAAGGLRDKAVAGFNQARSAVSSLYEEPSMYVEGAKQGIMGRAAQGIAWAKSNPGKVAALGAAGAALAGGLAYRKYKKRKARQRNKAAMKKVARELGLYKKLKKKGLKVPDVLDAVKKRGKNVRNKLTSVIG